MPNFKKELEARGLSVEQFAKSVGFSRTYVAEVLTGRREVPEETERKILAGFDYCHWCKNKWPHPPPKAIKTKRKKG